MPRAHRLTPIALGLLLAACGDAAAPIEPATLTLLTPPSLTTTAGGTQTVSVRVMGTDAAPMPGVSVAWAVGEGGGSVAAAAGATDSTGTASVVWTLGTAAGSQTLAATVPPLTPVSVTATVEPGAPAALTLLAPLPSNGAAGSALEADPAVVVKDAHGNTVPGASVVFTVLAGGGSISSGTTVTDGAGVATTSWTLGTSTGLNRLRASAYALGLTMTVTAVPGAPAILTVEQGDGQRPEPGTAVPIAPRMRVADQHDNPVPEVPVTFAVTGGGGSISNVDPMTDADGLAGVGTWTMGDTFGENTVSASVAGLPALTFTAEASPFYNLIVDAVHLNQGNQTLAGTAGGVSDRPGLLRVVVRANEANDHTPPVRVRLYQNDTFLREETIAAPTTSVPTAPDLNNMDDTWNLVLAAGDVVPGLRVDALVDPDDLIQVNTRADNRYPRGDTTASLDVVTLAPFRIVFFPIHTTVQNTTGSITVGNVETFLTGTRQWIPNSGIETSVRAAMTTDQDLSTGDGWSTVLSDLQAVRSVENAVDEYYHGIIGDFNGIAYGGLAYRPSAASSTFRSGLSYDRMPFSPGTIAHELGHNLGRMHAPCGNPGGPDPNYPHADATLGSPGYDILGGGLVNALTNRDYMSYCSPRWTSDYTYSGIVQWRRGDPYAQPSPPAAAGAATGLLVWGRISATGITLNPAFAVNAAPRLPQRSGPNALRGLNAEGTELFRVDFAGVAVTDGADPTERHFAFVVPLDPARHEALARLELLTPRGTAELTATAAEPVDVRRDDTPDASIRLRWDADRYPVALVRDRPGGQIVAIIRRGDARVILPAGFEVLLSDGVRSRAAAIR